MIYTDHTIGILGDHLFCGNCGHEMRPGEEVCSICGTEPGYAPPENGPDPSLYKKNLKSEAGAVLISAVLPGMGILYAGRAKGALYFIGFVILSMMMYLVPLGFVIIFLGWLFLIYKSYETVRSYNSYLMTNGRPPW